MLARIPASQRLAAHRRSKTLRKLNSFLLVIALIGLLFLSWQSARTGYASLLTASALSAGDFNIARRAVRLSPTSANAQVVLGALLEANDDRAAAISHYQTAVKLRPEDYVLWLQLARGQELGGDTEAAVNSAGTAVTLAPSYAQPHWQLGNILVRAGRADEGFGELRLAGASDPLLLPGIIDLAWQLSGGKVEYVIQALQPHTSGAYKALAAYFKNRNHWEESVQMFRAAGEATEPERRAYIAELISAKRFQDAHTLWRLDHPPDPDGPLLFDGGFEEETNLDEPGFGWRASNHSPSLTLSLDDSNPQSARSSLRVDFNGESNTNEPVISQLVLLDPKARYQLSFAYRTDHLVSGGLPGVLILDPNDNKVLAQTDALAQTSTGWQTTTIAFTTGESTSAIQIAVQRKACSTPQCPIFGKLWLDSFFLGGDRTRLVSEAGRSVIRGRSSEVGGQRSEVRDRRSEIGGQRSEVRDRRSEVRGQRSEVRGQRSEVGGQRSAGRFMKL